MKKIWILLVIALVVLLVGFREGLEATATIKAPFYDAAEKDRIWAMVPQASKNAALQMFSQGTARDGNGNIITPESQAKDAVVGIVTIFYNRKYREATTPITQADVDAYVTSQGGPPPMQELARGALTAYFINQPPAAGAPTTGPAGSSPPSTPSGPTGPTEPPAGATGPPPGPPPGTPSSPGANTTGGSSVTNWGGGGSSADGRIWGPPFSGTGTPRNLSGGGGNGGGEYPTLLGPPSDASAYWAGVGVVPPSKNTLLKGSLPSSASLGSDPLSGFLPYSRQPGDQDLVPDPYRVSQTFSSASYSSKNEPVPFLTDFSAFQK